MTKVTTCMPERGDGRETVQTGKGDKKKGERRVRAEGTRMVCMGKGEHPADTSNKTKDMKEGNTQTPRTAMEGARVPDNTWMRTNAQAREC